MLNDVPGRRQRGLSLVELLMFIVIVSIALVGILQVFQFTAARSADPVRQKQALMIAEALLEEVQSAAFTFCDATSPDPGIVENTAQCQIPEAFGQTGPEPGGTRPFDNINDYVAVAGQSAPAFDNAAGVLVNANGNPMAVNGYTARLTITPAQLNNIGAPGNSADADVLRITVAVSYDGETLVLDGYRTRFAPLFQ
jgi:MSHA pilin protein MshD